MHAVASSSRTVLRAVIALGLVVLLLVGAWSNSHGESSSTSALCVATGASATSVDTHQDIVTTDAAAPDAGILGLCAIIVFLLLLVALQVLAQRRMFRMTGVTASAAPRAGPRVLASALTRIQLSISRT